MPGRVQIVKESRLEPDSLQIYSEEHLSVTCSNVIKYLFGFSTLTAHDVMNQSIMIRLLEYLDQLFLKISPR